MLLQALGQHLLVLRRAPRRLRRLGFFGRLRGGRRRPLARLRGRLLLRLLVLAELRVGVVPGVGVVPVGGLAVYGRLGCGLLGGRLLGWRGLGLLDELLQVLLLAVPAVAVALVPIRAGRGALVVLTVAVVLVVVVAGHVQVLLLEVDVVVVLRVVALPLPPALGLLHLGLDQLLQGRVQPLLLLTVEVAHVLQVLVLRIEAPALAVARVVLAV